MVLAARHRIRRPRTRWRHPSCRPPRRKQRYRERIVGRANWAIRLLADGYLKSRRSSRKDGRVRTDYFPPYFPCARFCSTISWEFSGAHLARNERVNQNGHEISLPKPRRRNGRERPQTRENQSGCHARILRFRRKSNRGDRVALSRVGSIEKSASIPSRLDGNRTPGSWIHGGYGYNLRA